MNKSRQEVCHNEELMKSLLSNPISLHTHQQNNPHQLWPFWVWVPSANYGLIIIKSNNKWSRMMGKLVFIFFSSSYMYVRHTNNKPYKNPHNPTKRPKTQWTFRPLFCSFKMEKKKKGAPTIIATFAFRPKKENQEILQIFNKGIVH